MSEASQALCDIHANFGLLQLLENDISLRKWSHSTVHLRSLEGTLRSTVRTSQLA